MGRYTGAVCKLCRREGVKLFLKGDRCYTEKCAISRRNYPPGYKKIQGRGKLSDYGIRLREKQKLKRIYGILERQFRNYFEKAANQKGITGDNLLRFLERRLDNLVFRMGLAITRSQARQFVRHGHVLVNGKKADIPSYLIKQNDKVTLAEKSKSMKAVEIAMNVSSQRVIPEWIQVSKETMEAVVSRLPERKDIDIPVEEQLVVELYSK